MIKIIIAAILMNLIYPQTYIITEIDKANDLVTIETCTGYEYQFYGIEDYYEGDLVSCIMCTNGTETITDDMILTHRYSSVPQFYEEVK
jgi:hypothetical protein